MQASARLWKKVGLHQILTYLCIDRLFLSVTCHAFSSPDVLFECIAVTLLLACIYPVVNFVFFYAFFPRILSWLADSNDVVSIVLWIFIYSGFSDHVNQLKRYPCNRMQLCRSGFIIYCLLLNRHLRVIQGGPKKVNPKCSTHNFVIYWPILKTLPPLQSPENLQRSGH